MINRLIKLNEKLISINENNPKQLKKYQLIAKILNEKDAFLKIDMEYAYAILRDLGISEVNLDNVYLELINKEYIERSGS